MRIRLCIAKVKLQCRLELKLTCQAPLEGVGELRVSEVESYTQLVCYVFRTNFQGRFFGSKEWFVSEWFGGPWS